MMPMLADKATAEAVAARRARLGMSVAPKLIARHVIPAPSTKAAVREAARRVYIPPRPPADDAPRWRKVLYQVAVEHGVAPTDLTGSSRAKPIAAARHKLCYRLVTELGMSLCEAGRKLGRDHTTILHSVRAYCALAGLPVPTLTNGQRVLPVFPALHRPVLNILACEEIPVSQTAQVVGSAHG